MKARNEKKYFNLRSEGFIETSDLIKHSWLKILNEENVKSQLLSIKYTFDSKGRKKIEPKEDMKKRGLKSPNYADSIMMAVAYRNRISTGLKPNVSHLPRKSKGFAGSFFNESKRAMRGGR